MRLLTFHSPTGLRLGVKTDRGVIDVAAAYEAFGASLEVTQVPTSLEALLEGGKEARQALLQLLHATNKSDETQNWLLQEENLKLGPSASRNGKIICVGLNYRRHAAESGQAVPESPVLFPKYANGLAGANEELPLPRNAVKHDYEAELAFVIGRQARNVSEEDALNYVFGYCNANDLSARDLQMRTSQWLLGKALDKFLPVGPYLVTADEVGDPQKLQIRCILNGEVRQDSNTSDMIFPISYIVSYLSQYLTLEPGDLILTGTPEGVILGHKDPKWLVPSDTVTIEIERLGSLTNVLV